MTDEAVHERMRERNVDAAAQAEGTEFGTFSEWVFTSDSFRHVMLTIQ